MSTIRDGFVNETLEEYLERVDPLPWSSKIPDDVSRPMHQSVLTYSATDGKGKNHAVHFVHFDLFALKVNDSPVPMIMEAFCKAEREIGVPHGLLEWRLDVRTLPRGLRLPTQLRTRSHRARSIYGDYDFATKRSIPPYIQVGE